MRVWLDPEKVAARGLDRGRRRQRDPRAERAGRRRPARLACGAGRHTPASGRISRSRSTRKAASSTRTISRNIIIRTGAARARSRACATSRASSSARTTTRCARCSTTRRRSAIPIFQRPGSNAIAISDAVRAKMAELKKSFPEGIDYNVAYDPTVFVRGSIEAVLHTLLEAIAARRDRRHRVPADLARVDHSAARGAGVADRHARRDAPVRLRTQHAVAVRARAGDRHRRRRRDRRRRERRTQHQRRPVAASRRPKQAMQRSDRTDRRDGARAVRGVRADRVHQRTCPASSTSSSR